MPSIEIMTVGFGKSENSKLSDIMHKKLDSELLKYSAGKHICCPSCGQIADYRKWVVWESPAGQHGASCADCWRKGLSLIHDDAPHAYLLSIGWKVTTLVDFTKAPRKPRTNQIPQKAGKALNTYLRKDIFAAHKRMGNCTKSDRLFPAESYGKPVELIDTLTADGADVSYAENAQYSAYQVAQYCAEFCRLNHLTA